MLKPNFEKADGLGITNALTFKFGHRKLYLLKEALNSSGLTRLWVLTASLSQRTEL